MPFEHAAETAMTLAIYAATGHEITYTSAVSGELIIKAVISHDSRIFPTTFDTGLSERDVDVRVLKSAANGVEDPRRGDTFVDAASVVYTVDAVEELNAVEWNLRVKHG